MNLESTTSQVGISEEAAALDGEGSAAMDGSRQRAIRVIKVLLFSASIVPSILAGSVAYHLGGFRWSHFLLMLTGLFLAQAGGDYLYYYFTHLHTDARDAHTKIFAGWKPLLAERYSSKTGILVAGFLCLAVDLILAVYFTFHSGLLVLVLAAAGGLIAIFFTPLMVRGFKEPVIFLAFGPLAVMGIVFVLTGRFSLVALVASLPVALWVTVVAHLKGAHFEVKKDMHGTVVLRLGKRIVHLLMLLAYGILGAGVALKLIPVGSLLALLSLPMALGVLRTVSQPSCELHQYLWVVVRSIGVLIAGGVLMSTGYLLPVGG